ncbi:MAG: sulfurtransferase TusA family protein [Candidatus Omnitrophota bacterium]|jgi:tRNA 2-thiouridine synthesizing protein A|nr:MAG: sulfurtransferase TusA family protein [Candidatus Omnitrophota bacterium]
MPEPKKPLHIYNFQGVHCPINYVKTKLALEVLDIGAIIEVIVDNGEPARHVPKSIEGDGQRVVNSFTDEEGLVHLWIEKVVDF